MDGHRAEAVSRPLSEGGAPSYVSGYDFVPGLERTERCVVAGFPQAMPIIPEKDRTSGRRSPALSALNATRSDLYFETNEVRQRFEAAFGKDPRG